MRIDHYIHLAGAQILEDIQADLDTHRTKLDQMRRLQENTMADLTRLNAAVALVAAYINTLKATPSPEDPAVQAGVDETAAALEALVPAPPADPPA